MMLLILIYDIPLFILKAVSVQPTCNGVTTYSAYSNTKESLTVNDSTVDITENTLYNKV